MSRAQTERNRKIVAMRARGDTLAEIGARFGLSSQGVARVLGRCGVAPRYRLRRLTEAQVRKVHRLGRAGFEVAEIAEDLGVGTPAIRKILAGETHSEIWREQSRVVVDTSTGAATGLEMSWVMKADAAEGRA